MFRTALALFVALSCYSLPVETLHSCSRFEVIRVAQLSSETRTYSVRGTVVNSVTGAGIRGALVQTYLGHQRVLLTGPDGRFQFDNLPAGQIAFNVQKPGYFAPQQIARSVRQPLVTVGPDTPPVPKASSMVALVVMAARRSNLFQCVCSSSTFKMGRRFVGTCALSQQTKTESSASGSFYQASTFSSSNPVGAHRFPLRLRGSEPRAMARCFTPMLPILPPPPPSRSHLANMKKSISLCRYSLFIESPAVSAGDRSNKASI